MKITYNAKTNDYMFRYLEKYVGKYRVLADVDLETNKFPDSSSFEDFYIPCNRGCVIKHTYVGNDILSLCFYNSIGLAKNVSKELSKLNIEHQDEISDDCVDAIILFNAKDIEKVAKVVKPKTNGKDIHPLSSRNLTKGKVSTYVIPEKDLDKLYKNTSSMTKTEKLQFFRKCNKEFLQKLQDEEGVDCKTQMKIDGLDTKSYLHMNGYWKDYVKFINAKLKNT